MKILQINFSHQALFGALAFTLLCCAPKEPVVFKGVNNIVIDMSEGKPVLKADVSFFNPNKMRMKLKSVNVDVLVDGAKSAEVKHPINIEIPAQSDFSVPITAQLNLKEEGGLLNTVFGLLGGKKYEVTFTGNIRIGIHGITVKVPVLQKQEIKLR
jgi:LEA14-like dessication related protein